MKKRFQRGHARSQLLDALDQKGGYVSVRDALVARCVRNYDLGEDSFYLLCDDAGVAASGRVVFFRKSVPVYRADLAEGIRDDEDVRL